MFDNTIITKSVCISVMGALMLSCAPIASNAQMLAPLSFSEMYALARSGKVEALRGSVHRGMNIDSVNEDGDTGLCVAAKKSDAYTYNAFRAAGANPRHPCTLDIPNYEKFVNSSGVVSINSPSRAAYSKIGKESYSVSPWVWWGVGALAVGGVTAAILAGSGGGGGSSGSGGGGGTQDDENITSIGDNLASQGKIIDSTSANKINYTKYTLDNENAQKIASLKFNENVVENSKYLNVILQAIKGGVYTNAENITLNAQNGTVAMAAVDKSEIINEGYINTESYNASLGMLASKSSSAQNNGVGVVSSDDETNGISMSFTGFDENNTIIGMYADTNSEIVNNGEIKGTATTAATKPTSEEENNSATTSDSQTEQKSASTGTMIGMETMIINSGPISVNYENIAENNGTIELQAGVSGSSESAIKVNLIGMGSYLDDGFMNASKNINRAESSRLTNNSVIDLSYAGNYTTESSNTLRKGTGGIVGMRSDANNQAENNGKIYITLPNEKTSTSQSEEYAVSAGMQSVHGGEITNNKKGIISLTTNADNKRGNYGMISVEGSGTVSGLYIVPDHSVINYGLINMSTSNSFAMASYNGGVLKNNGTINLGIEDTTSIYTKNVGLYGDNENALTTLINNGTINVHSYNSAAIENDFGGGTVVENNGTINIMRSAVKSYVFAGNYSSAINNGTINYYATASDTSSNSSASSEEFPDNYTLKVQQSAVSTKAYPLISTTTNTSSKTETAENNSIINLYGSTETAAMEVATTLGVATNNGTIYLNKSEDGVGISVNSIGMYIYEDALTGAKAVNNGTIIVGTQNDKQVQYSAAMASKSKNTSTLSNQKTIVVYADNSFGMYASQNSHIVNDNIINLYGKNNVAIYSGGDGSGEDMPQIYNKAINVYGENAIAFSLAGNADIKEIGAINICTGTACDKVRKTFSLFNVTGTLNLKDIKVPQIDGGKLINSKQGIVNNYIDLSTTDRGGYIFYGDGNSTFTNQTSGTISLNGQNSYGMYSSNSNQSTNYGKINVNAANSYGMYADTQGSVINYGEIEVGSSAANSYGMYAAGGATSMINYGSIVVKNSSAWGMYASASGSNFVNNGTISGTNRLNDNVKDNEKQEEPQEEETDTTSSDTSSATTASVLKAPAKLMYVAKNANIINNGTISDNVINFDEYVGENSTVSVGNGGTYAADSLSGTVYANSNITTDGFETTYTNSDSFVGQDDGINLLSGSYLFDAVKVKNSAGNTDVVMNMKQFEQTTDDLNLSQYLQENYDAQKREDVFNQLKSAKTQQAYLEDLTQTFGYDFIANIVRQNLYNEKTISQGTNAELLKPTAENTRTFVRAFTYHQGEKSKKSLMGYDDNAIGADGFYDAQISADLRAGFGLYTARINSDYDDSSSFNNNMIGLYAPIIYSADKNRILIKPKAGFAFGHYRRAKNSVYKANTKEYFYGADLYANRLMPTKFVDFVANAGLDLTGLYSDKIKESNNGLIVDAKNMFSAVSFLGMDLKKTFALDGEKSLTFTAGGKYYHEFGNKYHTLAALADTVGKYELSDSKFTRNYGLLEFKAEYEVGKLALSGVAGVPLDSKQTNRYMLNLGYKF